MWELKGFLKKDMLGKYWTKESLCVFINIKQKQNVWQKLHFWCMRSPFVVSKSSIHQEDIATQISNLFNTVPKYTTAKLMKVQEEKQ